jgi:hypothetical protein
MAAAPAAAAVGHSWHYSNREDLRLARRTAADITSLLDAPPHLPRTCPLHCVALGHAVPAETVSIPAVVEAGVQAKVRAEAELEEEVEAMVPLVVTEVEAKELTLEEFKRRLEVVEVRVSAMEPKSDPEQEQQARVKARVSPQSALELITLKGLRVSLYCPVFFDIAFARLIRVVSFNWRLCHQD